ncbi:MAG: hypothetical protein ACI9UN_004339 [Granulosicoccus sp.]|jgi:hypothetical protein
MEYGAGYNEFVLAEGSLVALGWLALYGNDNRSLRKATSLMETAARLWLRANDVYVLQSNTAYSEMINLDGFTN